MPSRGEVWLASLDPRRGTEPSTTAASSRGLSPARPGPSWPAWTRPSARSSACPARRGSSAPRSSTSPRPGDKRRSCRWRGAVANRIRLSRIVCGQACPPERAANSRRDAGRKFRGGNGQGVERLSSASTLARRSWKRSATSIQSRLRARLTALLTSVMCEGGREASSRTTTDRSMTAIRSALTTEVVFKPV